MTDIEEIPLYDEATCVDLKLQESHLAVLKEKAKWKAHKSFYHPIVRKLELLGIEPFICGSDLHVTFTGDKKKLADVMRILMTSGMTFTANRPKLGDTSWNS